MRNVLMLALITVDCGSAYAETTPTAVRADARIKDVAYNADDVVKVVGHYGYSTNIEFASYEDVQSLAVGDSVAWEIAPVGNHLFVKPREANAVTNMTVVTNRRTYEFSLDANDVKGPTGSRDDAMFFQVRFRYPDDEAAARKAVADAKDKQAQAIRLQTILDTPTAPRNWDYWGCGTRAIWPTEVYDDGRFTFLRFPFAQELPAVFMVNADGTESLANGGMQGDQYVVQLTAQKFVLRKGESVACVQNHGFYPWGVKTPSGTTNPRLERKLKDSVPRVEDIPSRAGTVTTATTNAAAVPGSAPRPAAAPSPLPQATVTPTGPHPLEGNR